MPRKNADWITFQPTKEEKALLEEYCKQMGRSKSDVLRELVRGLSRKIRRSTTLSDE